MLQKVAINSAMIGSKSHIAGETPSSEDIVQDALQEISQGDKIQTAGDMGIQIDCSDNDDDDWGGDDWD